MKTSGHSHAGHIAAHAPAPAPPHAHEHGSKAKSAHSAHADEHGSHADTSHPPHPEVALSLAAPCRCGCDSDPKPRIGTSRLAPSLPSLPVAHEERSRPIWPEPRPVHAPSLDAEVPTAVPLQSLA